MKKRDLLKSRDFRVALLKGLKRVCQYVSIFLSIYQSLSHRVIVKSVFHPEMPRYKTAWYSIRPPV